MDQWTGERRWGDAARESATALRERRGDDGLWRQDDDYRGLSTLHGAAGHTLALLRFKWEDAVAHVSAAVLARHAFREDGLANWPGTPRPQFAPHGTEGSVSSTPRAHQASLAARGTTSTRASSSPAPSSSGAQGPPRTRRPRSLPRHPGHGFALLKAFARTGDERWSNAHDASRSTPSPKPTGSRSRMAVAVTRSPPVTSAQLCSPPPASMPTRATRYPTSCRELANPGRAEPVDLGGDVIDDWRIAASTRTSTAATEETRIGAQRLLTIGCPKKQPCVTSSRPRSPGLRLGAGRCRLPQ